MIPVDAVVMLTVLILFPLALILIMRQKVVGKMLCFFLEEDKSIRAKLLKVKGDFVPFEGEAYLVKAERVRLIRYPMGWPSILQQTIPASQYHRGQVDPQNWIDLSQKGVSATEVGAVLEPTWMANIVRGIQQKDSKTRLEKAMPLITIGLGGLSLILIYVVVTKINEISSLLK